MQRKLLVRNAFSCLVAGLVFAIVPAVQAVTIDAFTDPFPPNPDLPVGGYELIFVGSMCDGGACPPGTMVSHLVNDVAYQTGLAGVLAGERYAEIAYVAGTANGVVFNGFLSHNHNAGAKSILELKYGTTVDLNANLTLFEGTRLEINVVDGDMYAGPRPVPCTITVTSGRGTPAQATASKTLSLINAGVYAYPFTSFPGVDFTDVDMITVRFDSSAYTSVDYAIGPFRTDGETVPVESATWGRIKSMWR
jgi:hypothetical protein